MGDQEEDYERNEQNVCTQLCAPEHACPGSAPSRKPATAVALNNYYRHLLRFSLIRIILLYISPHSKGLSRSRCRPNCIPCKIVLTDVLS